MTNDFRRSSRRVFLTGETPPEIAAILDEYIAEFMGEGNPPEIVVEDSEDSFVPRLPDDEGQA